MKKLFALLLMLTVSIGSWAYDKDWSQETGNRYYNLNIKSEQAPAYEQYIISGTPGEFARWCEEQTVDLGYLKSTSKTVLHVQGTINADDVAAICSNLQSQNINGVTNFKILDFSDATGAENTAFFNSTTPRWQSNQMIIFPNAAPPTKSQIGYIQLNYDIAYYDSNSTDLLYVYVRSWDQGLNNFENLNLILGENNGIYFLPWYNQDGNFSDYQTMAKNGLFDKLASVPVASYDFTMCNANMPTDFSGNVLSPKTHFLTLPVTDTKYDITAENIPYENNKAYIYNDNIYVVSTFKSNASPYAKFCGFNNKSYTAQEPTNFTYVREEGKGHLGEAANLISIDQRTCVRQVFGGHLDHTDVSNMEMMHATKFDFVNATISEADMLSFKNENVQHLALPDNLDGIINGTVDNCSFFQESNPNCPALLCVGAYNTTSNKLTTWSKTPGNVDDVTSMVRPIPDTNNRKLLTTCVGLNHVVMSGALNFDDISTGVGLNAARMQTADLSKAYFPNNTDMNFAAAGWAYENISASEIYLPTDPRQTLIPDGCMNIFKSLESICIPYNYKNIGKQAFKQCENLSHITTTDANGKLIDNGEGTYTLSANLAYDATTRNGKIGTEAFNTGVHEIHDIYVLATTAPKCDVDAFSNGMVFGWGGFKGNQTHPVCRDNYENDNHFLFTILHFPADATDPEHYTDVTRDYSLMDETGAYDGQGNPIYWPLMEEFYKSYNQAMNGVIWADDSQVYTSGKIETLTERDGTQPKTYNTEYAGWHQFVLSNYGHSVPTTPQTPTSYYEDDYYTLCFPFDMSRDEVLSILGVKYDANVNASVDGTSVTADVFPKVYTLKSVTRIGSMITLEFSQDLMALAEEGKTIDVNVDVYEDGYSYEANLTQRESDNKDVYIKGGYPYLVKPILPTGTTISSGLAKYIMSKHVYTKDDLGNKKLISGSTTEYFAAPVDNHKVIATNGQGQRLTYGESTPYYYYFQGTYIKMPLPEYAYFLGKKSGETSKRFFRHKTGSRNWSAYSSIIGGKCPENAFIITEGTQGKEINGNATYAMTVDNDDFESAGVKYQFTIEGEDGFDEAVNIEKIDGEVVNAAALEGDVFNVAGQRVGTSIEGLSKGLYIVNGKKVLVK